jgi:CIC family chloride channel protein
VLEGAIHGEYVVGLLLALLLGKIVATSLTMAIGGSGGVFAPSLFIGAMLGSAFGTGAHDLLPGVTAGAGAYGLVGIAAVFAAAGRAPITAVLIVFELTGDYSIILPLMLAVVVATGLSKLLSEDSIYTLKLRSRGIDIERPPPAPGVLGGIKVATAMRGGRAQFVPRPPYRTWRHALPPKVATRCRSSIWRNG